MRSGQRFIRTILYAFARPRRSLPALLAVTAILGLLSGTADAQGRSRGGGYFGGGHAQSQSHASMMRSSRYSTQSNQRRRYKATATRHWQARGSRNKVSIYRPHPRPGKTGMGGKRTPGHRVTTNYPPRPTGERHPSWPRRPYHPIRTYRPPVLVSIPPATGMVPSSGSGGPPRRFIGSASSGSGGGGGGQTPTVTRRAGSGIPPINEQRYVPDEVVLELAPGITEQDAQAIAGRFGLVRLEAFTSQLGGTTLVRWRIPDGRSVPAVVGALQADGSVISAQPNYLAVLSGDTRTVGVGDPAQYALAKLQMVQAHAIATGADVLIAVVDSGIDMTHPELAGMIADSFDAVGSGDKVHKHGTGIAGAIVAHAKLMGTAPAAKILAIRSFGATKTSSEGTTFNISRGLNWAVEHGARIINMSFAGPRDPTIERDLAAAYAQGIVLVAAAGNDGPTSPPLYPAANPNVIAVSATDEDDNLFSGSNQGRHIAVAAPGVDIYLPAPGGIYQMTSGTSFSAAEVSGTVALLLQRRPDLTPIDVRKALMSTARDLGPRGFDPQFGAGLVDAYKALMSLPPPPVAAAKQ